MTPWSNCLWRPKSPHPHPAGRGGSRSAAQGHTREAQALDGRLVQFQDLGARLERLQVQLQEKAASNAQMHARLQATVRAATLQPYFSAPHASWTTSVQRSLATGEPAQVPEIPSASASPICAAGSGCCDIPPAV